MIGLKLLIIVQMNMKNIIFIPLVKSPQILYLLYKENLGGIIIRQLFNSHLLIVEKELATILGLNEALVLQ